MKKFLLTLAMLITMAVGAQAQLRILSNTNVSGTTPSTCNVGDIFYLTAGSTGLYVCTATNTWTQALSAAGTPSFTSATIGNMTLATSTINATSGSLVLATDGTAAITVNTSQNVTFAGTTTVGNLVTSGSTIAASGGSAVTFDATGDISLQSLATVIWNADTGISRNAAATLRIGNGTQNDASGTLVLGTIQLSNLNTGASSFNVQTGGTNRFTFTNAPGLKTYNSGAYGWTASASDPTAAFDTTLCRSAAGIVEIGTSACGTGGGIAGVATNSSAAAGVIGEVITAVTTSGAAVTLATGSATPITSITLTAGDWDLWGVVDYTLQAATSVTYMEQGTYTNASCSTAPSFDGQDTHSTFETAANVMTATVDPGWLIPNQVVSLSGSTKICLIAKSAFTAGTAKAYGTITARRMR
jgi:hypothetical protein